MACFFKFDLGTPLVTGTLSKQGRARMFNKRFFVLYPDFLVYYNDSCTWQSDVWRRSLSGRLGAVYLKNATCVADLKYAFGLLVTAPDQRNKKRRMLLSASDAMEQRDWITAISNAAPPSTTCESTFVPPMQEQDCAQEDVQRSITPSAQSCNPAILMSTAFREATTWSGGLEEDY